MKRANEKFVMIKIIMIREISKINIGQIVEIREYHSVVEYNMDRNIMTDQGVIRTIKLMLEEEIIETIIIKEVGVCVVLDNIQIIPEGMIEAAVGLDQV